VRDFHLAQKADMTLLSAVPPDPFGYGRIIRKKKAGKTTDEVAEIVEEKSASPAQKKIREINSGIYAFSVPELFVRIDKLSTNNAHHEFYLTDMAELFSHDRKKVVALPATDSNEVLGVNTRFELAGLDALLRAEKARRLMTDGVTIFRPETCVIDSDVTVGPDTVIEPFVQLLGKTSVGGDCVIRSYSVIKDSRIGDAVTVRNGCIMEDATIENGAIIGPYSHLRPASHIGENAHVGNFVETKKTRLGKGSKTNHLTYLGDAEIGEGVNIGAGTITCNYDGVNKHKTTIDDGAFIGSDSTLVAPVKIGRGAYVGAASCITENVPEDALALGRGRQVNKEGWAKAKREEMKKKKPLAISH
jgi:bifunctional UDP-N-acetylglucosamine pyrophosphorylase/glucosamine-1-phosphate N-acetyltransferase